MKEAGYSPSTGSVFHDVEDDDKTNMVRSCNERLPIAFGLISTLPRTRLLITKNLRICEDCHLAIKFISKMAYVLALIIGELSKENPYGNFRSENWVPAAASQSKKHNLWRCVVKGNLSMNLAGRKAANFT